MDKLGFKEWLFNQFIEWEKTQPGRRSNFTKFSEYLGASQPQVSSWIKGTYKPSGENIKLIAEKLGLEIYDVLELPRPNPYLQTINRLWEFLPQEIQIKISQETEKYETQNELHRLQKSPKQRKAAKPK